MATDPRQALQMLAEITESTQREDEAEQAWLKAKAIAVAAKKKWLTVAKNEKKLRREMVPGARPLLEYADSRAAAVEETKPDGGQVHTNGQAKPLPEWHENKCDVPANELWRYRSIVVLFEKEGLPLQEQLEGLQIFELCELDRYLGLCDDSRSRGNPRALSDETCDRLDAALCAYQRKMDIEAQGEARLPKRGPKAKARKRETKRAKASIELEAQREADGARERERVEKGFPAKPGGAIPKVVEPKKEGARA